MPQSTPPSTNSSTTDQSTMVKNGVIASTSHSEHFETGNDSDDGLTDLDMPQIMHIEEFVVAFNVNQLTSKVVYRTQGLGSLYSEMPIGDRRPTSKQIDSVNFYHYVLTIY